MKTFVLCVGAEKAGTTWLYEQLRNNWFVDFGFCKEYDFLKRHFTKDNSKPKHFKSQKFYDDPEKYFEYFDSLNSMVVGDFSPSYCRLNVDAFQYIKQNLQKRKYKVKVIFLMREPFKRIWSHYNHDALYSHDFYRYSRFPAVIAQTNYDKIIANLNEVFHNVHYEFYENLFNETSYKKITDFIDVPWKWNRPNFSKINETVYKQDLPSLEIQNKVREKYKSVYDFVYERFPEAKEYWEYK